MKRMVSVLLVCSLVTSPAARSSIAVAPPAPSPLTFALPAGVEVVVESGYASTTTRPTDRLEIMLALVGSPIPGTGQLADVAAIVRGPSHPITQPAVDRIAEALVAAGLSRDEIRTRLVPPSRDFPYLAAYMTTGAPGKPEPFDRLAPRPVGMLLVDVHPIADARLATVERAIDSVAKGAPNLTYADIVVRRDRCDDSALRSRAVADARANAIAFAGRIGLRIAHPLDVSTDTAYSGAQIVCAGSEPVLPFAPRYSEWPRLPTLYASVSAKAVFAVDGEPSTTSGRMSSLLASSIAPDGNGYNPDAVVARGIVVPPSRPFASGRGTFDTLVRPDVLLIAYRTNAAPSDLSSALAKMRAAALSAGAQSDELALHHDALAIRFVPTDTRIAAVRKAVEAASTISEPASRSVGAFSLIVPFVRDCETVRRFVARGAVAVARRRVGAMAAAAGVPVGPFLGASDGREATDAVCGYGQEANVADLVAAASHRLDEFGGAREQGAEFSQTIVAAWELAETPPAARAPLPQPTVLYSRENADRAYVGVSGGPIGEAKATLQPGRRLADVAPAWPRDTGHRWIDEDCLTETSLALGNATRAALAIAGTKAVRALVDLGIDWREADGVCGYSVDGLGSGDPSPETATERMMVLL